MNAIISRGPPVRVLTNAWCVVFFLLWRLALIAVGSIIVSASSSTDAEQVISTRRTQPIWLFSDGIIRLIIGSNVDVAGGRTGVPGPPF